MSYRLRPLLLVALLQGAAACASGSPAANAGAEAPQAPQAPQAPVGPLATLATQPVIVVPAQRVRAADEAGWSGSAGDPRTLLAALDDEIAFAVRERGTGTAWKFAPDVARMARRSPTVAGDPYALAVEPLIDPKGPKELRTAPIASQLRALVALGGQRYALVPAELRFARRADGQGELVLRVALVDARGASRLWSGEVRSQPASTWSRGLLTSLAGHLADLIAPPDGAPGA